VNTGKTWNWKELSRVPTATGRVSPCRHTKWRSCQCCWCSYCANIWWRLQLTRKFRGALERCSLFCETMEGGR